MENYTFNIPKMTVPLPSKGLIYPLKDDGSLLSEVSIRAMTAIDENILHSPAYVKSGVAITKLVEACIVEPKNLKVADMITGDVNFILYMIRLLSYGSEYRVDENLCPKCKETFEAMFDLQKQGSKDLEVMPCVPNQNLFSFMLPQTNVEVKFKLMTRNISNEVDKVQKAMEKIKVEAGVTSMLQNVIVEIDNKTEKSFINKFINEFLTAKDSLALRNYIKDITPALDLKQVVNCEKCGELVEVEIPLSYTFLYPDK